MSIAPSALTVQVGAQGSFTISVTALSGFSAGTTVSLSGAATGVALSPATFSVAAGGSQAVTVTVSSGAAAGTSNLTLAATSGVLSHSATVALTIQAVPQPDFSLSASPSSLTIQAGAHGSFAVALAALSGFTGTANVSVRATAAGVSASPASFTLVPGASQSVDLAVSSQAAVGSSSVTVTGTSAALSHSTTVALAITAAPVAATAGRLHYVRTDSALPGDLGFFPQQHVLYSASTRRFFFADQSLNRVHVFDAKTETKIAEIVVPGAFQVDETADGATLWVGTQTGDLYTLDPAALAVTHRYRSSQIGPTGYAAFEVHPMADGRMVLLGGQGGIAAVDGYGSFALWDPATNALATPAMCVDGIALSALTADRKKFMMTSYTTSSGFCIYDPATDSSNKTVVNSYYDFSNELLVPPDNKEVLVSDGHELNVFSLPTLQLIDVVPLQGFRNSALSRDGNTLFLLGYGELDAYNWRTHARLGWSSSISMVPMTVDETGLIAGLGNQGIAFADGAMLLAGSATISSNLVVTPAYGPPAGGTTVQLSNSLPSATKAYFGPTVATTQLSGTQYTAKTPAGSGLVDVTLVTDAGNELLSPEAFSYGPTVIENTTPYVTADGGGVVTLYGAGLESTGSTAPADLHVSVGGQPASITTFAGSGTSPLYAPFLQFAAPASTPGTSDLVVTTGAGSSTVKNGLRVLPAVKQFPLPGATLYQGVYDAGRDLYYFTDQSAIQVFSRTQGKWLSPISMPATAAAKRLWGLSLSPDGARLAVADAGNDAVYLLDPSNPMGAKVLPLSSTNFGLHTVPCGVALTNAGIVYIVGTAVDGDGARNVFRLDTATGKISSYANFSNGTPGECQVRTVLSHDGSRAYVNDEGVLAVIDTATDRVFFPTLFDQVDDELALSANQTTLAAGEYLFDTDLGVQSYLAENGREAYSSGAVYGQKVSPDGSLLFQPLTAGLDFLDARTGVWLGRVGLPVTLAANYDALVVDGTSNVLVAITGKGDGVAILDMSTIAIPNPLLYTRPAGIEGTFPNGWTLSAGKRHVMAMSGSARLGILERRAVHPLPARQ